MRRESPRYYLVPALLSALVHAAFAVPLFFRLAPPPKVQAIENFSVLDAVSIDASAVEQEVQRLRDIDTRKEQELKDMVAAAQAKTKAAEQAAAQAEQKRQQEVQRLEQQRKAEEQKRRQVEQERKAEEQKRQQAARERKAEEQKRQQAERERKAEEQKKQQAEQERKAEEERKRKAEQERKAEEERKRKAEQERKAEEERKRKAEQERKAEEERKRKEEQARKEAQEREQRAKDKSTIAALVSAMSERTSSYFNLTGLPQGLRCKMEVRLSPGGEVLGVVITGSSGNDLFDRRAELAVKKAAPFPVPDDPRDFERIGLGKITFTFDPARSN